MYDEIKKKLLIVLMVMAVPLVLYFIDNVFFLMSNEMTLTGSVISGIFGCCAVIWIIICPLYLGTITF